MRSPPRGELFLFETFVRSTPDFLHRSEQSSSVRARGSEWKSGPGFGIDGVPLLVALGDLSSIKSCESGTSLTFR